jgi:uncharacterized protein YjiS (DUF1127 family)
MIMSATWRVVETNDRGIRVGKRFQEIASLVSTLAENAHLWFAAYRARQRMRKWVADLDDHLLDDIGVKRGEGRRPGGLADALMQMTGRRSHF